MKPKTKAEWEKLAEALHIHASRTTNELTGRREGLILPWPEVSKRVRMAYVRTVKFIARKLK